MRRDFLKNLAGGTAATAATLAALPATAMADESATRTRVVVQMSDADPARWNLALNNVRNLQEALGADKSQVELVAFGPGIGMLKADSSAGARVAEASKAGVAVLACENSMRGQKLEHADMLAAAGYVPAGVVHIVKRQQEGWAYLRP